MNIEDMGRLVDEVNKQKSALVSSKNKDYSYSSDVHANFRCLAELCKALKVDVTTPEGCMEYMVLHKIHRLFKLINDGTEPNHESIFDNGVDEEVYMDLLIGYVRDGKGAVKFPPATEYPDCLERIDEPEGEPAIKIPDEPDHSLIDVQTKKLD